MSYLFLTSYIIQIQTLGESSYDSSACVELTQITDIFCSVMLDISIFEKLISLSSRGAHFSHLCVYCIWLHVRIVLLCFYCTLNRHDLCFKILEYNSECIKRGKIVWKVFNLLKITWMVTKIVHSVHIQRIN